VPPAPRSVKISQDGRWIAFAVDNRVELVPLRLDAEEIEYRRFHSRPNARYYSEGYVAARQAKDDFATRFYLDRLIEFSTAANKPDEVKKWQAERAKYSDVAPPPRQKK
jgi:hypothetical protein